MSKTLIPLRLTAALVLAGHVVRAGTPVEVEEHEARNYLARGKAVLADGALLPTGETAPPAAGPTDDEILARALKDQEMDRATWDALSDKKRTALLKQAAGAIAADAEALAN